MVSVARRSVMAGLATLAAPGLTSRAFAAGAAAYPALQAMLDGYVAAKKLPGGVVAVSRRGRAAEYVAAGTLAFDTDARAAPDSIYRVYSMTKPDRRRRGDDADRAGQAAARPAARRHPA